MRSLVVCCPFRHSSIYKGGIQWRRKRETYLLRVIGSRVNCFGDCFCIVCNVFVRLLWGFSMARLCSGYGQGQGSPVFSNIARLCSDSGSGYRWADRLSHEPVHPSECANQWALQRPPPRGASTRSGVAAPDPVSAHMCPILLLLPDDDQLMVLVRLQSSLGEAPGPVRCGAQLVPAWRQVLLVICLAVRLWFRVEGLIFEVRCCNAHAQLRLLPMDHQASPVSGIEVGPGQVDELRLAPQPVVLARQDARIHLRLVEEVRCVQLRLSLDLWLGLRHLCQLSWLERGVQLLPFPGRSNALDPWTQWLVHEAENILLLGRHISDGGPLCCLCRHNVLREADLNVCPLCFALFCVCARSIWQAKCVRVVDCTNLADSSTTLGMVQDAYARKRRKCSLPSLHAKQHTTKRHPLPHITMKLLTSSHHKILDSLSRKVMANR